VWIPSGQVSNSSKWLAARLAPFFAWLLNYLHPLLHALARLGRRLYPIRVHTGLYDKQDLIDLLTRQSHQLDNRINAIELSIAVHALTVADRKVEDILTPRRVVKAVSIEETVGPVLMSELHDSGLSRFPVYSGKKDNVVGTLYLRDLVNAEGAGSVRQLMHTEVRYIHEDQSALEALQAMIKTKHHLFIVVNSFEEYVGVVTLEDVVEEVIGQQIVDEFDQYEDMRAVAASQAKKDHKEHQTDTEAPDTIEA
jgi:metal transporter CNNM